MGALRVVVTHVEVVAGATLGYGEGVDGDGNMAYFVGDHRPMLHIAEALEAGTEVEVLLEEYQIQRLFRLSERIDVNPGTEGEAEEKGQDSD